MTAVPSSRPNAYARVIEALHGIGATAETVTERQAKFRCPAHEDHRASLSVTHRDDAAKPGAYLHCHAGCETLDVVAAIGLTLSDLYDAPPAKPTTTTRATTRATTRRPARRTERKPSAAAGPVCLGSHPKHDYRSARGPEAGDGCTWHEYLDEAGPVAWKVRRPCRRTGCTDRTFAWRYLSRSTGEITWKRDARPELMPLYRQAEAAGAAAAGQTVYVTEGESDADAIAEAGGIACTHGNADLGTKRDGTSWKDHHTAALTGAGMVLVCADRDASGLGHRSAAYIAQQLAGAGIPATVVEPVAGKDVRDHLAAGLTLAELHPVDLIGQGDDEHQPEDEAAGDEPPDNVLDLPTAVRLPRGAWRVASTRTRPEIWAVGDGGPQHGLFLDGKRISDLPIVHTRMPARDDAGDIRGWRFLVSGPDGCRQMLSAGDIASGVYIDRLGLNVPADKGIREACETTTRELINRLPLTELAARWSDDGRLIVPEREALPRGYLVAAGSEPDARAAWREIGTLASREGAENLALNLGAAYAAPYVAALSAVRPVSFAMVGIGQPRRGKTTNSNAAAAWYGSPILVNPVVSESTVAIGDTLADLGVLPFFRDEAHAAGWTQRQWHDYWMRTLNGAGRRRSSSDGSGVVRSTRGWWGVQWWTGNVDPRFGATDGVQARVVALHDPHLPDAETSDRITDLISTAYGWPIRWQLAKHPTPSAFRDTVARARHDLGTTPDGSGSTVAGSLALAIAGAEHAGAMFGTSRMRQAALTAARRVLATLVDTIADAAVSFGDQLLEDIWTDVQMHPALYPPRHEYEAMMRDESPTHGGTPRARDVHGFRWEHDSRQVVSIIRGAFRELTCDAEYAIGEALTDLSSRRLLIRTAKTGYLHSVKINGRRDRFYTFREHPETDDETGANVGTPDGANGTPADDWHPEPASDLHSAHGANGANGANGAPPCAREDEMLRCRRCGEPVDPVAARATGGFHIGCAPGTQDCPQCGRHVAEGVRERFAGYHPACAPDDVRDAGLAATDALRRSEGATAPTGQRDTRCRPFGRQRGTQGQQGAAQGSIVPLATQVEDFGRNVLRDLGAELAEGEAAEALAKFSAALDGLEFHGWWGQTGADAYAMVCARDGLTGRGVAMVEQVPADQAEMVQTFSNDAVLHRDHISGQPAPELGAWITELDINAQFPTATGGLELGHGVPTHLAAVRSVEGLLRGATPGYLRLGAPLTVTGQHFPATHNAWRDIEAGRVLTLNYARWLAKHGVQIEPSEALIWPEHRRHLRSWSDLFRVGRMRLKSDQSPMARIALGALKMTANTTVGGWLKSQKNHGDLMRPDYTDQIICESWVRALAAVENAGREGDLTLGMRRDSAWWVADHGPYTPRGVTVSDQGGKWKHSRWAQVDAAIREAHATGVADTLNRAIKAAHEKREGEQK